MKIVNGLKMVLNLNHKGVGVQANYEKIQIAIT